MGRYLDFLKSWRANLSTFGWICRHTRPFLGQLLLMLILQSGTSLIAVGLTQVHKRVIDATTTGAGFKTTLIVYAIGTAVSLLLGTCSGVFANIVSEKFSFGIRRRIYHSLMRACLPDTGRYHSGDIITRLSSDVGTVAAGIAEILPSVLSLAVMFVAAFAMLSRYDRWLAFFALLLGPVIAVISLITGRSIKRIQAEVQKSESAYRSYLQESVENLIVLKAFEGQDAAERRFEELRRQRLYWVRRRQKIGAISRLSLSGSFQLGFVLVLAYSAYQLSLGRITFGTLTMFNSLVGQIQSPIVSLGNMIPRIVSIFTSAERVRELEDLPGEDMEVPYLAPGGIGIRIRDLGFAYGEDKILESADSDLSAGQFAALMGSSGIGKTTLVRLIMALYLPQSGSIELVDDQGGTAQICAGARRYMSYVPQGNTLISGSIYTNLKYGRDDASEEEMWEVLEVVHAAEFVREMPEGIHTPVGERGFGLSEGQAQRIAIARALIRRAPLLILDEATSALDEDTELTVLSHLSKSEPRPTCVLITHRRSVLQFCDRCLRIHNKRIEEVPVSSWVEQT